MSAVLGAIAQFEIATSCGTLVLNKKGQLLLCHVTGGQHWDIPKGMREPGESTLEAARRELMEETGLVFETSLFEEIGGFDYLQHKRIHLYKVRAPESLETLDHLICTSHFLHHATGKPIPEMDGFRWVTRDEIASMCLLPLAQKLLSLDW